MKLDAQLGVSSSGLALLCWLRQGPAARGSSPLKLPLLSSPPGWKLEQAERHLWASERKRPLAYALEGDKMSLE